MTVECNIYICPTCNSDNIVKLSLIYKNGISSRDTYTDGVSHGDTYINGHVGRHSERENFHGQGTSKHKFHSESTTVHQTQASIESSPPSEPESPQQILFAIISENTRMYLFLLLFAFIANAFIVAVLEKIYLGFLGSIFTPILCIFILLLAPCSLISDINDKYKSYSKSYPQIMADWKDECINWSNSYECQKCEERFVIFT